MLTYRRVLTDKIRHKASVIVIDQDEQKEKLRFLKKLLKERSERMNRVTGVDDKSERNDTRDETEIKFTNGVMMPVWVSPFFFLS